MCPDPQIVSLYHDGELPSPWKEKLESHLGLCPDCRARLEGYRGLSAFLSRAGGEEEKAQTAARERVWQRLKSFDAPARSRSFSYGSRAGKERLWRRSVSIPLPAAAAAALFMVVLFAILAVRFPSEGARDTAVAGDLSQDMRGIVPVSDMQGVLQYLGDHDAADFVILRLPESRSFTSTGEPAIIRAADYTPPRKRQSP